MKIISKNLREQLVKVQVETLEDLWHLEHVLELGDLVTARTLRKASVKSGGEYEYADKRPMILTIRLEKMEFKRDSGVLRLNGPIVEGPDDVPKQSHHSMQIDVNDTLTIRKERWKAYQLDRLEKARVKKPLLLICVLDREEADFAMLKESGIEMKASIENYNKENMEGYYDKIISYLKGQEVQTIVLAGPGFERENLLKYINSKERELARKIILEHSSATGINGVHEILKKSANRILRETRIAKESEYVNEILKRMKTDDLVVYGPKETAKAIEAGAVETLFVSQEKLSDFEKLMEAEEKMRGAVVIIGSDHELGGQFLHLGGIAGFLRFKAEF